jgi:hypothetical protein
MTYRYALYLSRFCCDDVILYTARTLGHAVVCLHECLNCRATASNRKRLGRGIREAINVPPLNVSFSSAISIIPGAFCITETSQAVQKLVLPDLSAFLHATQPFWANLRIQA